MNYPRHTLCYLNLENAVESTRKVSSIQAQELDFLYSWMAQGRPLITTRQPPTISEEQIQLAIPYFIPTTTQKIRMSYLFFKTAINKIAPLPSLSQLFPKIPEEYHFIRVYGSYCWQYLTQHPYVRPTSDLDLLIEYSYQSLISLNELHHHLTQLIPSIPIDGEVRFPDIGECSYKELIQTQEIPNILFKSEKGIQLISREYLYARFPTLIR